MWAWARPDGQAISSRRSARASGTLWEKPVGFRPFGKDIMIMDPAIADHGEAVNKLARKLGLPQ
jgi:hypothetical protein